MAMFAKRHYEAIATALQDAHHRNGCTLAGGNESEWSICVESLADTLARDNGQFKRERFIAACQPGANVRKRS